MNSINIIGNVCNDPELRTTTSGVNVCTFRVAVNNVYKKDAPADFFRVTTWRKDAEACGKYVKKGMKVGVIGSVSLYQYDYNNEHRAEMQIEAKEVEFLTRSEGTASEPPEVPESAPEQSYTPVDIGDDELPF